MTEYDWKYLLENSCDECGYEFTARTTDTEREAKLCYRCITTANVPTGMPGFVAEPHPDDR